MGWLNDNDGVPLDTWPSYATSNKPQTKNEKIAMGIIITLCFAMLIIAFIMLNNETKTNPPHTNSRILCHPAPMVPVPIHRGISPAGNLSRSTYDFSAGPTHDGRAQHLLATPCTLLCTYMANTNHVIMQINVIKNIILNFNVWTSPLSMFQHLRLSC